MIFIRTGQKQRDSFVGFVVDFCPVCRELRPFALNRVENTRHMNGAAVGTSEVVGFSQSCQTCGFYEAADPARFQNAVSKMAASLDALMEETYPEARVDFAQRLFLEDQVRADPEGIEAEMRGKLIREPFFLLVNQARQPNDIQATPAMIAAIVLALIGPMAIFMLSVPVPIADPLDGTLFFGGMGYILWCVVVDALARRRRAALPLLVQTLRPLRPTVSELSNVLQDLTIRNLTPWIGVKPERLLRQLEAAK